MRLPTTVAKALITTHAAGDGAADGVGVGAGAGDEAASAVE